MFAAPACMTQKKPSPYPHPFISLSPSFHLSISILTIPLISIFSSPSSPQIIPHNI
ncbi:MAG TPA: hypothetical protein PK358_15870 [Spirochaetota bacterium]|nr:hypothetical protein [Spirochaetota bacterium]